LVERMEFHDNSDSGGAISCITDERRHESGNFADLELGHGNGCNIV
jgi:hypothetical protein